MRSLFDRLGLSQLLAPSAAAQAEEEPSENDTNREWWIISHTGLVWRTYHVLFLVLNLWDMLVQPLLLVNFALTLQLSWVWPMYYFIDAMYLIRIFLRLCVT